MRLQKKVDVFKTRFAKRGLAGVLKVAQVGAEHQQVGRFARAAPVPADAPGQLDQRAHRRRLDHGPVVVVVAAHFGDGRSQHDEQMIGFALGIEPLANIGQTEHGL